MSGCPFTHPLDLDAYRDGMPYAALAEARAQGSFVHYEDPDTGVPYWAAVKRDALDFVSQNPALFSSEVEGPFPMEPPDETAREVTKIMNANSFIAMDPPKHVTHRRIVKDAFTPKAVAAMEPWLRQQAKEIVDRVASRGECEFVEEVAAELPLMAILELLGVPLEDRAQFFKWTNTMAFADDPDIAGGRDGRTAPGRRPGQSGDGRDRAGLDIVQDPINGALVIEGILIFLEGPELRDVGPGGKGFAPGTDHHQGLHRPVNRERATDLCDPFVHSESQRVAGFGAVQGDQTGRAPNLVQDLAHLLPSFRFGAYR